MLVPRKPTPGDPDPGLDGMIYYNSAAREFRAHEDGTWSSLISGGAGSLVKRGH